MAKSDKAPKKGKKYTGGAASGVGRMEKAKAAKGKGKAKGGY